MSKYAASMSHISKNGKLQTFRIATKSPQSKYQACGVSECQEGWCGHTQWVHLRPIDFIAYLNTAKVADLSASIRASLRLQFGVRKSSSWIGFWAPCRWTPHPSAQSFWSSPRCHFLISKWPLLSSLAKPSMNDVYLQWRGNWHQSTHAEYSI